MARIDRGSVEYTFAVTGHRMDRLGGYDAKHFGALNSFCLSLLRNDRPDKLIVGCALGTDLAFASAAMNLSIPYVAAVPFRGWNGHWSAAQRDFSKKVLENAAKVVYVSDPPYTASKMHVRNHWMIDNADAVYCLWDGKPYGGTFATKTYAENKNKTVIDLWYQWQDFLKGYKT